MTAKRRWCARCKVELPPERVEALPEARLCIKCSEEVGGEFEVKFTQENLSKPGSLKKNYGAVTLQKKRRPIEPKDPSSSE
ncbi:MAG TPA: TraR/DksA C4-type zinc finger protein [Pirellulales bacterium]|nr:TraR/DksA C4-type zinc finger protein [Pirellulales bacterium]